MQIASSRCCRPPPNARRKDCPPSPRRSITIRPKVRAEVVRAVKKIGGKLAQFVIDKALEDDNDELRRAAEEALKESE